MKKISEFTFILTSLLLKIVCVCIIHNKYESGGDNSELGWWLRDAIRDWSAVQLSTLCLPCRPLPSGLQPHICKVAAAHLTFTSTFQAGIMGKNKSKWLSPSEALLFVQKGMFSLSLVKWESWEIEKLSFLAFLTKEVKGMGNCGLCRGMKSIGSATVCHPRKTHTYT